MDIYICSSVIEKVGYSGGGFSGLWFDKNWSEILATLFKYATLKS